MSQNKENLSTEESRKGKLSIDESREEKIWTEEYKEPRATVYHNFLSKEECDHLISLAKPHLTRSRVFDSLTGEGKISSLRTSSGMNLKRGQDKIVDTIETRIAEYTSIPIENGEDLQVLHYAVGQKCWRHFDYTNGSTCMATLLMYLSDVEKGGETVFPKAGVKRKSLFRCLKLNSGVSVKPKMGDALLFWSTKPDGTLDPKSLHRGSPVIKGDKWIATKWMHVNKYT